MIKISFPANDKAAALEFGKALLAYSGETVLATTSNKVPVVQIGAEEGSIAAKDVAHLTAGIVQVDLNPVLVEAVASLTDSLDQPALGAAIKVDPKGVAFDPKFCAAAKDPFYASGAKQDQWKTKRGVTDDAYDKWYFDQLALQGVGTVATAEQPETNINVGAAFGQAANTPQTDATVECPADAGKFMVWVSELQAAGRLTEEELSSAYTEAGITSPFSIFQDGGYAGVQAIFPVICRMAGL